MDSVDIKRLKFVFYSTLVIALTLTSLFVLYKSYFLFFSAFIGIGTACLMSPVIDFFENKYKVNRFLGTFLFLIIIGLLFVILFFFAGSVLLNQFSSFKQDIPSITQSWETLWGQYLQKYPRLSKFATGGENSELASSVMRFAGTSLMTLMDTFTGLGLAVIIALFSSANYKNYFLSLQKMMPKDSRSMFKLRAELAALTLRKWFYAQFLDMCVVGVLTTLGLWIVGVKYWALYGLLAGVLSIIPYAGLAFVFIFSGSIIAVTQLDKLVALILVFIVTQNLEGNFIMPKLMKDHVKIPAALLIFCLILMGSWFGTLGALITTPVMAIVIAQLKLNKKEVVKT